MRDFRDVIDLWPSLAEFAADIGVTESAVKMMRLRNSIKADHFKAIVESAARRGLEGVTSDRLAEFAARRSPLDGGNSAAAA